MCDGAAHRCIVSTTTYGWEAVLNRNLVQVDSNPALTTTYNAANQPVSDSAGGSYAHDEEGRLTARPGQTLEWDSLGRLTAVRDAAMGNVIAAYSYDALDRLLVVAHPGVDRVRFRYVGLTTRVAEVVDDTNNSVIRSVANDWAGSRLLDWTGSGSNQRFYGTNGHHDATWTASDTGAVTASLRYDPWGNLAASTGTSLPDFRFQGSWFDTATDLQWVVTRWYAPALGRFVSEDSLLGSADAPPSRHLYVYGSANPINTVDPDGRCPPCAVVAVLVLVGVALDTIDYASQVPEGQRTLQTWANHVAPGVAMSLVPGGRLFQWGGRVVSLTARAVRYGSPSAARYVASYAAYGLTRAFTAASPRVARWSGLTILGRDPAYWQLAHRARAYHLHDREVMRTSVLPSRHGLGRLVKKPGSPRDEARCRS